MSELIYQWERKEGPKLVQAPLYVGHSNLAEVSLVDMQGKLWLDLDSGYDSCPPIPIDDLLWLLKESGLRITD